MYSLILSCANIVSATVILKCLCYISFVSLLFNAFPFCRGVSTGIYATSSPDGCYYVLENSRANIVIVDEQEQLDKILKVYV